MDLALEMRARFVSIEEVHVVLGQGPNSLRHIQENSVDHLGTNISISILFCSTWQVNIISSTYYQFTHFRKTGL